MGWWGGRRGASGSEMMLPKLENVYKVQRGELTANKMFHESCHTHFLQDVFAHIQSD